MVSEEEMQALVGHRLPEGSVAIEHWEAVLTAETTASPPLADGIAHPVCLFHVPLNGVGMRIADFFVLFKADSDEAVRAGEFRWSFKRALRENVPYRASGEVVSVERKESSKLGTMDLVTFRIDLHDQADGGQVASASYTWLLLRS